MVGPDGLEPQFARGGKGKPPSGNVPAKVTLAGGMATVPGTGTDLVLVGKNDVQTVTLNTNPFNVGIRMSFGYEPGDCTVAGENSDGVLPEEGYLLGQLATAVARNGSFHLQIDKTDLSEGTSTRRLDHRGRVLRGPRPLRRGDH